MKSATTWRCHPDLNWGVELLQSSALPLGYGAVYLIILSFIILYDKRRFCVRLLSFGAEDEIRTRDVHLGKVTLYH